MLLNILFALFCMLIVASTKNNNGTKPIAIKNNRVTKTFEPVITASKEPVALLTINDTKPFTHRSTGPSFLPGKVNPEYSKFIANKY